MIALHPALFALALVTLAAADDRELVITWPTSDIEVRACAKAPPRGLPDPCEAVNARRWQPIGTPPISSATIRCVAHPNCFNERSECIEGFNCR